MIEYAIFIVMVIFTVGFAWLWFTEQKKKRTRREALERAKKRVAD
jgi:MFS-type transporter involved in bile tolerance (Atg22 family)